MIDTTAPVVCWDKDSTLAHTLHRRHLALAARDGLIPWTEYARACTQDEPMESARVLMQMLAPHYWNVVMSGSSEVPEARQWLDRHGFAYHAAYFRPADDESLSNTELKVGWIRKLQEQGHDVRLFVEDWPEVAAEIRAQTGVPVLVLNPCYPVEQGTDWDLSIRKV